jgi:hypothetical protein
MLRWLIRRRLAAVEKQLGVPLDYCRYILDVSLGAFLKFAKLMPLAHYRRALPAAPFYVAQIVATRAEDCGPCVQITVNFAKKTGVSHQILQAAVVGEVEALPDDLALVYRFAEAVVARTGEEDELRGRIEELYGKAGLVELALAIAVCRVFPTTKRALGFATSCSKVAVTV